MPASKSPRAQHLRATSIEFVSVILPANEPLTIEHSDNETVRVIDVMSVGPDRNWTYIVETTV